MKYQFNDKVHLHSLDGKPLTGTSSVTDVLAKNLTWWAAELAAVTCLESGEHIPTIRSEYEAIVTSDNKKAGIDELQKKYPIFKKARYAHNEKKKDAAVKGTDLHAELEHWVKAQMGKVPERADYDPKIIPFIDWAKRTVKRFLWSEAHCFDEELWVGGISDCGVELKDGRYAVIDFKSAKEAYPGHAIQAAGYALQIERNGLWDCEGTINKKLDRQIDAVIVVPFGGKVEPVFFWNITDYKNAFKAAVTLYRLMNN